MTEAQYWDGESSLFKQYKEADRLKQQRLNEQLWLQGMYVYEAICDASPILHDFAKRGTKPIQYPKEPYDLFSKPESEKTEIEKVDEAKAKMERIRQRMEMFAAAHNASLKAKEKQNPPQ